MKKTNIYPTRRAMITLGSVAIVPCASPKRRPPTIASELVDARKRILELQREIEILQIIAAPRDYQL